MIRSQRNRHRWTWLAIGIALPTLVLLSVLNRPSVPVESDEFSKPYPALGEVLKQINKESLEIHLRGQGQLIQQVEINLKEAFPSPSAAVFARMGGERVQRIGELGKKGRYRLQVNVAFDEIEVYDYIKRKNLLMIPI